MPAAVVGCVIMNGPAESADELEAFMLNDVRYGVEAAAGLVTHEIYRMGSGDCRLLVIHSWRTIEDIERFRAGDRHLYDETLKRLGVTTERLANVVAAELSRLEA